MDQLIQISCERWSEIDVTFVNTSLIEIVTKAREATILPLSLEKIIVTDQYLDEYKKIAEQFGLINPLIKENEFVSAAKMCFNRDSENPKHILLIDAGVFGQDNFFDSIMKLFLETTSNNMLPDDLKKERLYYYDTPLLEMVNRFFPQLFESLVAQILFNYEGRETTTPPFSARDILAPFKRRVKNLHFKYQSDFNFEMCVIEYYRSLNIFLKNYVDIYLYKLNREEFNEFDPILDEFGKNLFIEVSNIINKRSYSLDFLRKTVVDISSLCFFKITESPFDIKVKNEPKHLFPDLLDTHDSIVAFVDIQGFSKMVEHFDQSNDTGLLTDLKESLDSAIQEINKYFPKESSDFEFRLFSDCLCLSVSYYNNRTDFPYQFGAMMLALKTYQGLMIQKGYLVRGGVTIGPYYSDKNMIFSGAMIEAYHFETNGSTNGVAQKEKPPRILVSPKILKKLNNTIIQAAFYHYYIDGLLIDRDGEVFINPIFSLSTASKTFDHAMSAFNVSDDFSRIMKESFSSLVNIAKSMMTPELESAAYDALIKVLDQKIERYKSDSFVSKYIWTKELVLYISSKESNEKFKVYTVEFEQVVDAWSEVKNQNNSY